MDTTLNVLMLLFATESSSVLQRAPCRPFVWRQCHTFFFFFSSRHLDDWSIRVLYYMRVVPGIKGRGVSTISSS